MDKTNALHHEARIQADENRSKEVRHFSASVVEAVEELQGQLSDAEESNKAVERALKDVDYRGTYADGVLYLKQQLAAALAACEVKDAAIIKIYGCYPPPYSRDRNTVIAREALAIKPDASTPVLNKVKAVDPRIDLGRYAGTYGGHITDAIEKGEKGEKG